ncbi:Mog1p/PsbP-like protein [Piromyces finnis]|uniref:Mog1p/PsbP-like protein n=1 Tax=Piromyces finnis TaxID=1754191 RepID=A0A1Y1VKW1_9FUNG|nr:Mog1p/PsbP-like protein [Piromyces finnis]|eukprot:ORX58398.1 Mog1p/PsbP-like protein [Piromyces finnis]
MQRELFGGAITAVIPEAFRDASIIREVPDNQEVYVDINTDQSIIVELLEQAEEASNDECGLYHFKQLAEDNNAENFEIIKNEDIISQDIPNIKIESIKKLVLGKQIISKFNEKDPDAQNIVNIYLAVIRVPSIETDMLISYNCPVYIGSKSSSRTQSKEGQETISDELFKQLIKSFNVVDWELFN